MCIVMDKRRQPRDELAMSIEKPSKTGTLMFSLHLAMWLYKEYSHYSSRGQNQIAEGEEKRTEGKEINREPTSLSKILSVKDQDWILI